MCVNSNVEGLYYQNEIESQHVVQKCIQKYKMRDFATMIKNMKGLSDREDAEKGGVLYGAGNYSIAGPYKRFCMKSSESHRLDENQRKNYVQKFSSFLARKTNLFSKLGNSGRNPFIRNNQGILSQIWSLLATKEMQIPVNNKHQVSKKHP